MSTLSDKERAKVIASLPQKKRREVLQQIQAVTAKSHQAGCSGTAKPSATGKRLPPKTGCCGSCH